MTDPCKEKTNLPEKGWTEKEHTKQSEPQKNRRKACRRIRKSCCFFFVRVYESVWTAGEEDGGGRRMGRGRMQKPHREARSINTGHANAAPRPLPQRLPVEHSDHTAYKKLEVLPREKCPHAERLSAASQADGMAFYRWRVGVSWRCIYRYFRWVVLCFLPDAC